MGDMRHLWNAWTKERNQKESRRGKKKKEKIQDEICSHKETRPESDDDWEQKNLEQNEQDRRKIEEEVLDNTNECNENELNALLRSASLNEFNHAAANETGWKRNNAHKWTRRKKKQRAFGFRTKRQFCGRADWLTRKKQEERKKNRSAQWCASNWEMTRPYQSRTQDTRKSTTILQQSHNKTALRPSTRLYRINKRLCRNGVVDVLDRAHLFLVCFWLFSVFLFLLVWRLFHRLIPALHVRYCGSSSI